MIKIVFKYLAILMGMLSVISLVQHFFDVGLNGLFYDFINYYRMMQFKVINLLHLTLPKPMLDFWTLSFIGAGAHIKVNGIEDVRLFREYRSLMTFKYWKFFYFIIIGVTFLGCLFFTAIISPHTYIECPNQESQRVLRETILNSFVVILGMILFFALNAYAPSL